MQSVRDIGPILWDLGPDNVSDCNAISELKIGSSYENLEHIHAGYAKTALLI